MCVLSDPLLCALAQGEFHSGQTCNPDTGRCMPKFCCRCTGDNPDACGGGQCQDNCTGLICSPPCVPVVTTGTCDGDGCTPTGCCQSVIRDIASCIQSDAETCEFAEGTFFPGVTCDSTTGQCQVPSPTPSQTPTITTTKTATVTAAPTSTRVSEGGACTDTSQCVPALVCVRDVCTAVNAPAPAVSRLGLLIALGVLIAIAAGSLRGFASRKR